MNAREKKTTFGFHLSKLATSTKHFTICCVHTKQTNEENDFWHFSRAANWNLGEPLWTGRMKVATKGVAINLKLEDKNTGTLYANCPIESYPGTIALCSCCGIALVTVRYFFFSWMTFGCCSLLAFYLPLLQYHIYFVVVVAGAAIEAVSDSSRYFVIRVVDDNGTWPLE